MPVVSVLMPVHNAARYLQAALDSMFAQTHRDFELIAVNDGSSDSSLSILKINAARDPRLRLISRPNTGIVGALNDALAVSTAPYIARMDADDLAAPTRFEQQLAHLRAHPDLILLGSTVDFIDADDHRLKTYRPPFAAADIRDALLHGNSGALIHPTIMGPRRAFTETNGYREPYKFAEDYDLFLRAARLGPLANLDAPLLRYRIHAQSTNYQRRAQQVTLLKELCASARASAGLSAAFDFQPAPAHPNLASVYREWAWWALEGREPATARRYARRAFLKNPFQRESLKLLRATYA